jgi:hypothetical protein
MALIHVVASALLIVGAVRQPGAEVRQSEDKGSLCVLSYVKLEDVRMQSPDVPSAAKTYTLRLDGGPWIALSPDHQLLFKDIPRSKRHQVVIRGDGRPFVAFPLTFGKETDLCLSQNDMYLTWHINRPRDSFRACRCRDIEPTVWKSDDAAKP